MSSSGIRIGNFFSTFDTESVISQLTALRQGPIRKLETQRKQYTAQKAALGGLQANFAGLLLRSKALTEAIENTENFASVSGMITMKGNKGNPPKRALVVEVIPTGQKFAKAYEPGSL